MATVVRPKTDASGFKPTKGSAVAVAIIIPPIPDLYRPPCYSAQRMAMWLPKNQAKVDPAVDTPEMRLSFKRTMLKSWQPATLTTMGANLGRYHATCDDLKLDEESRAPVRCDVFMVVMGEMVGAVSEPTCRNVYAAVKGWHECNLFAFKMDDAWLAKILRAARNEAPSKRAKRPPVTVALLEKILISFDPSNSLDAAVRACALVMLWGIARSGELTVPTESNLEPRKLLRPTHVRSDADRHGNQVTVLSLPWSKVAHFDGEDVIFAAQPGPLDPEDALRAHLRINAPTDDEHLFAFNLPDGRRLPLSKARFMKRIVDAAELAGINAPSGHSFRIGGTLEYLLRGMSFEVVKSLGRWSSDAFRLYLREHAKVLAPYVQPTANLDKRVRDIVIPAAR